MCNCLILGILSQFVTKFESLSTYFNPYAYILITKIIYNLFIIKTEIPSNGSKLGKILIYIKSFYLWFRLYILIIG